jgi:signal transduction histidine kinase
MVAFAGYPLIVDDEVLGVMAMFARQPLSQATLDAMATVASSVALAIERTRAEAAAEAERGLLRELLTHAPAIIGLYRGPDHILEFGNALLLRGLGDRHVLGRPARESFPDIEDQSLFDLMDQVYASGQPYVGNEVPLRSGRVGQAGEPQTAYFNFVYQPVRGKTGSIEAILVHAVDVTQQVRARQRVESLADELAAANRELEAFSYSVSHDLRAPLRAMDGFSRILLEEFADGLPDTARRYLSLVRENAVHMGRLIDDLLAFSRLSRHELARRRVDMVAIVQQVLEDLRPEVEGRRVEIRIGQLPPVAADPSLVRQVYANLLGNALKFTRQHDPATIDVDSRVEGGATVYTVRDNGVGFDMRYADKLFGVFQRLHRAEDYEGTGVGLAIVQRIVHRHGGRVWAESQPGQGATFFFTLESPAP